MIFTVISAIHKLRLRHITNTKRVKPLKRFDKAHQSLPILSRILHHMRPFPQAEVLHSVSYHSNSG